jgi:multidrug resistance efflux pump
MKPRGRIPIPLKQRWHDARLRFIPAMVFMVAILALAFFWRDYVAAPTMLGQIEPMQASVSCYKPGLLAELNVTRFQKVKAGDPVGRVLVTEPKILAASLAVIQADIEMLRVNMQPILTQQGAAMNYDQLRLAYMKERAQLASSKTGLQMAESEYQRMAELHKDRIVSDRVYEQAKSARDKLQNEIAEETKLVEEAEQAFKTLQMTNAPGLAVVGEDPLRAAIAAQESKLRLTEAELGPITLNAPVDGMVDVIYHRSGEAVTAGEPIVAIATFNSVRIIGYLRPPIVDEPKVGTRVQVRTRGPRRQVGAASIVEIGAQLEPVSPALSGGFKLASAELGLPLSISLPPNLKIRPGELVDLTLLPEAD